MRIGWLSTGRDPAASNLLAEVVARVARDDVDLEIAVVFCDRERGEAAASDAFLDLVERLGLRALSVSSAASWRAAAARGSDRETWRVAFHERVIELLEQHDIEVLVLAGYMLIVSPAMCERFALLNLHPALPGGPVGTWQEVIWRLLESSASETGAMMHLATSELDRGPVIAYVRFPIQGANWDELWRRWRQKRAVLDLAAIVAGEGEDERLFAAVRRHGEVREISLLYQTLRQFADGYLTAADGEVRATSGNLPLDLSAMVENEVAR